jgi:NitT/TauT family transport system substrate-binding protein
LSKRVAVIARVLCLTGIVAALFSAPACSHSYSGPVDSVTIGTVLQEGTIPIFIAEDQNFFAQNGLNVVLKYYDTGAQAVSGMLKNEVDIATTASDYVLANQVLNKEQIQTISSLGKLDYVVVIGRRDRGITAISQLAGKRIGIIRGTSTEFFLGRFLTVNGLDLKDVTLVNLPSLPQMTDAIIRGDVDAITSASPNSDDAVSKLGTNAVSFPAQGGQMIYLLAICKKGWISEHPDRVVRFLKATDQAEEFILRQPEDAKALATKRLNLTNEEVSRIWARNQFALSLDQALILAMEDEARWTIANNLTNEKTVPNFLDYIYADGLRAVKPDAVRIIGK